MHNYIKNDQDALTKSIKENDLASFKRQINHTISNAEPSQDTIYTYYGDNKDGSWNEYNFIKTKIDFDPIAQQIARHGHIEMFKVLLACKFPPKNFDSCLIYAAGSNQVEMMKFLCTSPLVNPKADHFYSNQRALESAIESGAVQAAQYLCCSNDFEYKCDTSRPHLKYLAKAAASRKPGMVHFLLNSPELTFRPQLDCASGESMMKAIKNNDIEMVKVLLFDYKYNVSKQLNLFLDAHNKSSSQYYDIVQNFRELVHTRDFVTELEHNLPTNNKPVIRRKI